jgi:fused signal recognition particle receptor
MNTEAKETTIEMPKQSWWSKLKSGLKRSSDKLSDGLKSIFTKRKLDRETLEELEELLISSDIGVETAASLTTALAKERLDQDITLEEVKDFLATRIASLLDPVAVPLKIDTTLKPHVILVVGVNGSGKTTTIGKLAKLWKEEGLKVHMAAGDTFRAAAVEQLKIWGQRLMVPVIAKEQGADSAGLAFDAYQEAQKANSDVLLIDTAGRLHNKAHLMEELKKVVRVLKKIDESAPHSVLLVLDATTGQNANNQVEIFKEMIGVSGLVMTKLDGTAKGGVIISLAQKYKIPIHAIGVGEQADDLRPFTSSDFARNLMGLNNQ